MHGRIRCGVTRTARLRNGKYQLQMQMGGESMSGVENGVSLTERACEGILQYIARRDLRAGNRIPSENELAEMLDVGRGTVREAIKSLISRNILVIRRGAGTFVSEKYGVPDDPLGLQFIRDKHKLAMDLLQVRFMIEPEIASMAARSASRQDIAELDALCCAVENQIARGENHVCDDVRFHTKIAQCSANSVVASLIPIINSSIELFVLLTKRQLLAETVQTHREVFEAIRTHNSMAAHDAMYLHLEYNRKNIEKAAASGSMEEMI